MILWEHLRISILIITQTVNFACFRGQAEPMRNRHAFGIARLDYERRQRMFAVHSKSHGFRAVEPFIIKYDESLPVDLPSRNVVDQRIMNYVKSRQTFPPSGQIELKCKYKQIITVRGKQCVATGLTVYIAINQEKKCVLVKKIHVF